MQAVFGQFRIPNFVQKGTDYSVFDRIRVQTVLVGIHPYPGLIYLPQEYQPHQRKVAALLASEKRSSAWLGLLNRAFHWDDHFWQLEQFLQLPPTVFSSNLPTRGGNVRQQAEEQNQLHSVTIFGATELASTSMPSVGYTILDLHLQI